MAPPRKSAEGVSTPSNKKSTTTNETGEASNSTASKKDSTTKDGGSGKDSAAQGLNIEVSNDAGSNVNNEFEIYCDSSCKSCPDVNVFDDITRDVSNDSGSSMVTQSYDETGESSTGFRIPLAVKDDAPATQSTQDVNPGKGKEILSVKDAHVNLEGMLQDDGIHFNFPRARKRKLPGSTSFPNETAGYHPSAHYSNKPACENENIPASRLIRARHRPIGPKGPTAPREPSGATFERKYVNLPPDSLVDMFGKNAIRAGVPESPGFHFNGTYDGGHISPSLFAKGNDKNPIGAHEMSARTFLHPPVDPPVLHHSELGYLGGGIAVGNLFPLRGKVDECLSLRLARLHDSTEPNLVPPKRANKDDKENQSDTGKLGRFWDTPPPLGPRPANTDGESDCVCRLCTSEEGEVESEAETDVEVDDDPYEPVPRWLEKQVLGLSEPYNNLSRPTTPEHQVGLEPGEPKTPLRRRVVHPLTDFTGPVSSGMTDLETLSFISGEDRDNKPAGHMFDFEVDHNNDDVIMGDPFKRSVAI
ncbi:MAG: hypothetical protein M1831_003024 [Alyxoria varia]|nr:MAG: hypothetical protein M1831_003024 [Alyxoria varia]